MPTHSDHLIQFIHAAKLATYAAQGDEASVPAMLPDSKQLEFSRGDWLYRDIYVGMAYFIGQEIVYQAGQAVWSMSYAGGVNQPLPPDILRSLYAFLRQALRQAPADFPLRGSQGMQQGEYCYSCQYQGSMDSFNGIEQITRNGVSLYTLNFAGGSVI